MNKNQMTIEQALKTTNNLWDFIKAISYDTCFQEYRNPIADEWRNKYIKPLEVLPKHGYYNLNVFSLESELIYKLKRHFPINCNPSDLSVYQMCVIVNGQEWANNYKSYLENNLVTYLSKQYKEMRGE